MIRGYKECAKENRRLAEEALPFFVEILDRMPHDPEG
jgi:hypothetical protein